MRQRRIDKKEKISPWISHQTEATVHDVALYLHHINGKCSWGDAARILVTTAMHDIPTVNRLALYFWRDHDNGNISWIGHDDHLDLNDILDPEEYRSHIRFSQQEWKELSDIAHALGRCVQHTTAALLILSIKDERIIKKAAPGFQFRSPYSLKRGSFQWGGSIQ